MFKITQNQWDKTCKDYKCEIDTVKYILKNCGLVPVEISTDGNELRDYLFEEFGITYSVLAWNEEDAKRIIKSNYHVKFENLRLKYMAYEEFVNNNFLSGKLVELPKRQLSDKEIENIWANLANVPVDIEEYLDDIYFIWEKGSDKYKDVWKWFDQNYSKGVSYLINNAIA